MRRGEPLRFAMALGALRRNPLQIAAMGILLALLLAAWTWAAVALFELFFGREPYADLLFGRVGAGRGLGFVALSNALGAALAVLAFASSVVALPMLLDRRVGLGTAIATSWCACRRNPGTMAVWAAMIVVIVTAGFATCFVGLTLALPLLGHATWHAYRELVAVAPAAADRATAIDRGGGATAGR